MSAWDDTLEYLRLVAARELGRATDLLEAAVDADGIGAIADAFGDVCRALMDRVQFSTGTIDVLAVIDRIALAIVETSGDERPGALDRQRSLLVYLGSEGLPCAARTDVASWSAEDRLHDLIACTIGLLGTVAETDGWSLAEIVWRLRPPAPPTVPEGTFELVWRGANGAEPLAGAVPRGYTAHITFVGAEPCSLRAVFARVARLRHAVDANADAHEPMRN